MKFDVRIRWKKNYSTTSQMQDHKPVVDHFSNGSNSCNISSSENDITIYIHQLPPPPKNGLS